mgnify:CR=1 FL=1
MELRRYLQIAASWLWLIILGTFVAGAISYAVSARMTHIYNASTTLLVAQASGSEFVEYTSLLTSAQLAKTYGTLLTTRPILQQVVENLQLDVTANQLSRRVSVRVIPDTRLLKLTVEYDDPTLAINVANEIARVFVQQETKRQDTGFSAYEEALVKQMEGIREDIAAAQARLAELEALGSVQTEADTRETDLRDLKSDLSTYRNAYALLVDTYLTLSRQTSTTPATVQEAAVATRKDLEARKTILAGEIGTLEKDIKAQRARVAGLEALKTLSEAQETELRELRTNVTQLQSTYSNLLGTYMSLIRQIESADAASDTVVAPQDALQEQKDMLLREIKTMEQNIAETSQKIAALEVSLAERPAVKAQVGQVTPQQEETVLRTQLATNRSAYSALLSGYVNLQLTSARRIDVDVVEPAQAPATLVSPRKVFNTAVGALAGFVLAVSVAFFVEYMDDTLKGAEDVEQALALPALSVIPKYSSGRPVSGPIAAARGTSAIAEAYRALRTNVQFANVDRPIRTLLVTSAHKEEGKSSTVANLGVVMAQAGARVLVVDSDLRRPSISRIFGLPDGAGLTDLLLSEGEDCSLYLADTAIANLKVLRTGPLPASPSELLSSNRLKTLIAELLKHVDIIIFDSPPVLGVTDAVALAPRMDGVILVVEGGRTRRESVVRARDALRGVGGRLLGVVLTKIGRSEAYYYYNREEPRPFFSRAADRLRKRVGRGRRVRAPWRHPAPTPPAAITSLDAEWNADAPPEAEAAESPAASATHVAEGGSHD